MDKNPYTCGEPNCLANMLGCIACDTKAEMPCFECGLMAWQCRCGWPEPFVKEVNHD